MTTEEKIVDMLKDMARRKHLIAQAQMMEGMGFNLYQEISGKSALQFDSLGPKASIVDRDEGLNLLRRLVAATEPIFAEYAKKWNEEALAGATPETDPSPVTQEDKE